MAFYSAGYTPERTYTLENGLYECMIMRAEEKSNPNGNYIEVTVQARGKKGYTPNKIFFHEAPVKTPPEYWGEDEKKKMSRWNRDFTRFFDCFGIAPGDFNISNWVRKIGWCKVAEQYDANEPDKKSKKFKALYPQAPEAMENNAPIPSVSAVNAAPVQNTPASVQAVENMVNDFQPETYEPLNNEEIPF